MMYTLLVIGIMASAFGAMVCNANFGRHYNSANKDLLWMTGTLVFFILMALLMFLFIAWV